jgi:acyl-CoA thioester hydrolase
MNARVPSPLTVQTAYKNWGCEQVRWSDTDMVGHVNNLAFGAFLETGRCHFLRPLMDKDAELPAFFLPAQITINFLGEAHWPAKVSIGTGVLSIGRTSCRLGQGLFDGDRCFGSAETVIVCVDKASHRPQPIVGALHDWLSGFLIPA